MAGKGGNSGGSAMGDLGGTGGGDTLGLNDGASASTPTNAHGDCVFADTAPDATSNPLCKATYDDARAEPCRFELEWIGSCGSYIIVAAINPESWVTCSYDVNTRRLVAERYCIDVNLYCDGAANCSWQGPDLGACYIEIEHTRGFTIQPCQRPDAGSD